METPYLFTFREILNLAKEFGRSLPGKHLIPRYFNIDRYERQKYGLISMCILSFDTSTISDTALKVSQSLYFFTTFICHGVSPGCGVQAFLILFFPMWYCSYEDTVFLLENMHIVS